jgi:hypothetical protein
VPGVVAGEFAVGLGQHVHDVRDLERVRVVGLVLDVVADDLIGAEDRGVSVCA